MKHDYEGKVYREYTDKGKNGLVPKVLSFRFNNESDPSFDKECRMTLCGHYYKKFLGIAVAFCRKHHVDEQPEENFKTCQGKYTKKVIADMVGSEILPEFDLRPRE